MVNACTLQRKHKPREFSAKTTQRAMHKPTLWQWEITSLTHVLPKTALFWTRKQTAKHVQKCRKFRHPKYAQLIWVNRSVTTLCISRSSGCGLCQGVISGSGTVSGGAINQCRVTRWSGIDRCHIICGCAITWQSIEHWRQFHWFHKKVFIIKQCCRGVQPELWKTIGFHLFAFSYFTHSTYLNSWPSYPLAPIKHGLHFPRKDGYFFYSLCLY